MPAEKPWRDQVRLEQLYLSERKSTYEIAEELGCSRVTISNWLGKFDIERRSRQPDECVLSDEQLVRELYQERELSLSETAAEAGCTVWKVRYWLEEHGIERRAPGGRSFATPELTKKEWLLERYMEKDQSVFQIAEKLDCSTRTVTEWLDKHDISCPWKLSEEVRERLQDEQEMRRLYETKGLTTAEIAQQIGCSPGYAGDYLRRHGITDYAMNGSDHPRWSGGEYAYGAGWSEGKRESVRERDDRRCRVCAMTEAEHEEWTDARLHVHHIRKARNVDEPEIRNAMENLITLCASCHVKADEIAPELPEGVDD